MPDVSAVLARELASRDVVELATHGHVGTSVLLHATERRPELRIHADSLMREAPGATWLLLQGRTGQRAVVAGYREVLRLHLGSKKVLSLRERR